tara:strand:+ start:2760 stop:3065 length:306 start_codon:yes stop_codon:yes gene_type:complete
MTKQTSEPTGNSEAGVSDILKDVPMPRRLSSQTLYTSQFENMEVGDCFIVEDTRSTDPKALEKSSVERQLRSSAYNWGKRLDRKFSCRRVDGGNLGVWRTE